MNVSRNASMAYYITAHGYGHGVRSCAIIRAIHRLYPQVRVHIVSCLPEGFLRAQIGPGEYSIHARSFDVGMVQLDSIRADVDATLERIEAVYAQRTALIEKEAAFLRDQHMDLIVADIPALPLEAAARLGIPRLAVGNFSWDWIYSAYVARDDRWKRVVQAFREAYAAADGLLRLPFHGDMTAFRHIVDIPLVASPGQCRREAIERLTGCRADTRWILLSFTTLEWSDSALAAVERLQEYDFFTVRPLAWERENIHVLDREQVTFSDAVASVDAVISKPGFGIVSDCIVNRKPLIYADRVDFLEYPILEDAIRKYLRHVHIPAATLYQGQLQESLDRVWESPDPVQALPHGGDSLAAQRIMGYL